MRRPMSPAAILVAAALVAAPGAGLVLAVVPPGMAPLATQAGLVVPFGIAWVATSSLLLALLHLLSLPAFLTLYLAGTVAAWIGAVVRRGATGWRAAWRADVRDDPWGHAGGFVVLASLAATRLTYSPVLNLADQTPLRYWADGLELADAHRIPALSLQWGRLFPSTVSKVVLNAFDAAGSLVLGRGPLGPMGALLVAGSVGLLLVTFAFAREIGLRRTAPIVVIALFANHVIGPRSMTDDLVNFRAETWGRLLVLAALVLAVRAFRSASPRGVEAVASGVLFGLAAGTHLVPTVVGLAFVSAYALGRLVFERRPRPAVRTAAVLLASAGAVAAFVLFAPRGDIGFQGAGNTEVYRGLAAQLGLPQGFDPTRFLALGQVSQPPHTGAFYDPPATTYHEYVRRVVGEDRLRRPFLFVLPVAGVIGVGALLRWGDTDLRALAVASASTAAAILVVALAFNLKYDVYVLAEFGPRRLFDYTAIPAVLLAAGVFELVLHRLGSRAPATALAGALALASLAVPRNVSSGGREQYFASALAPLAWIQANVPCGGRVLADRRTLATFETLTRHAGVTEGMGPYLRPAVLATAVRTLLDTREFFLHPDPAFLRKEGVAAVVVTSYDQTLGGVGGPLKPVPALGSRFDRLPFLQLAVRTSTVRVYRVIGFDPAASATSPDVRRLPGYECGAQR